MHIVFKSLLAAAVLVSCGDDPAPRPPGLDGASDGSDGDSADPGVDPLLTTFSVQPDAEHPLVQWVTVATDAPGTATLTATAPGAPTRTTPAFAVGTEPVTVPFLGLRAEATYAISLTVQLEDGRTAAGDADATTGALPDDLPPVEVTTLDEDRVTDGFVILPLSKWTNGPIAGWGYVIALDEGGAVAWYIETEISSTFRAEPDGTVLLTSLTESALQLDALGAPVRALDVTEHGVESIHHDWLFAPGAADDADPEILLLSSELQVIDGYPDGLGGTRSHNVIGDVLVQMDWQGGVRRELSLFGLLDPLRTTPDFDLPFWNIPPYDTVDTPKDWTHANAIVPMDDGTWLVSLRNQDWLILVDPDAGSLVWTMGLEGDFDLLSGRWFSTQHSPQWLDERTLLMYDNGARRPDEGFPNSRVVVYDVDIEGRTVTQLWEYTGESPYYVPAAGDVDLLDGGMLVTDGGVVDAVRNIGGVLVPHLTPRVVELAGEPGAFEPVLSVRVGYWGDIDAPGYIAYRGDKVRSLYGSRGVEALAR